MASTNTFIKVTETATPATDWKQVKQVYVNDGTAWRQIKNTYVNDGTTWQKVYQSGFFYSETISAPRSNYNVRNQLTTAGWNGSDVVSVDITINPGVVVYSTATSTAAFTLNPALPAGSSVTLTNAGTIVGMGGAGGSGGDVTLNAAVPGPTVTSYPATFADGAAGSAGGRGMTIGSPITIDNTGGVIAAGGGGGGGGKAYATTNPLGWYGAVVGGSGGSGGGGSSQSVAIGGPAGTVPTTVPSPYYPTNYARANGNIGTSGSIAGGATTAAITLPKLAPAVSATFVAIGGTGGAGGARGSAGSAGGSGSGSTTPSATANLESFSTNAGTGGATGVAIQGRSLITFSVPGTVTGPTAG
jgi:hypothetical protein